MDSRHEIDLPMQIALGWTLYVVTMVFGFSAHILFSIFERNNFACSMTPAREPPADFFIYSGSSR
jgi:hypothetical protein